MKKAIYCLVLVSIFFLSCEDDGPTSNSDADKMTTPIEEEPEEETPVDTSIYCSNPLECESDYVYNDEHIVLAKPTMDIQNLIDSLSDNFNAGTVMLDSGTYVLENPLLLASGITIMGRPDMPSEKMAFTINSDNFNTAIITNNEKAISRVSLYNFTLDGTLLDEDQHLGPEYHSDGLAAADPSLQSNRIGILITGDGDTYSKAENTFVTIRGLEVKSCAMGIHVKGTSNLLVRDCYLHHNGMIEAYYHNIYLRRCFQSKIDSSRMMNSPTGNGINVSQSEDITLSDNTCSNNFFRGLRIEGESGYVINYITVLRNLCEDNGDAGCRFRNTADGIVKYNESYRNNPDVKLGSNGDLVLEGNSWN